jgi:hypothetical protein
MTAREELLGDEPEADYLERKWRDDAASWSMAVEDLKEERDVLRAELEAAKAAFQEIDSLSLAALCSVKRRVSDDYIRRMGFKAAGAAKALAAATTTAPAADTDAAAAETADTGEAQ